MKGVNGESEVDRLRRERDQLDVELSESAEEASTALADIGHLAQAIADLTRAHKADVASLNAQARSARRGCIAEMRGRREAEQAREKLENELGTARSRLRVLIETHGIQGAQPGSELLDMVSAISVHLGALEAQRECKARKARR